ncbi:tautomerase family protein [Jannaschia seohaensis]|uniref:4-oxalocrotonate tautomerase n=1 Tax=Jannaschia seohaensis TaxID=475081 RepID=A0A2Y9B4S4_9RHOB|nr:tautomerase family protein [Jannaschia seohaensis]PWJ10923.1 4-oxalocrotonate tautomerase [Jannaschia seohaensis]SSA51524.1 4-oxalocrotonate tautomerase [Jannaschia seohaensis]
MPSIEIQVLEGVFSDEEKAEIIRRVTEAFGSVAGKSIRDGTSVRVFEARSGSWGWGGNVLTTQDALAMRARDVDAT